MTRRLRALALTTILAASAGPAAAHQLIVFASVQGDAVVVETKFSNGKRPKTGDVRVYDGADTLLYEAQVDDGGLCRVDLSQVAAGIETGLRIEVSAGSGHDDYWILTPDDIEKQRAAQGKSGN